MVKTMKSKQETYGHKSARRWFVVVFVVESRPHVAGLGEGCYDMAATEMAPSSAEITNFPNY